MFWKRDDIIEKLNLSVDLESVKRVREDRIRIFEKESWREKVGKIQKLPGLDALSRKPARQGIAEAEIVRAGAADWVDDTESLAFKEALRALMPWRKGPFELMGHFVDAEWRSNRKWDRVEKAAGDLNGKRILDVGCGNGYYIWRAAAHDPQFVLGLDPSPSFLLQFELFQKYLQRPNLQMELLGFEHLNLFRKTFDIALCMGILYHHSNPVDTLKQLRQTLRIGGKAIIESQAIAGQESMAIFPQDRYAKARNVFFVPTAACLANWAIRAGFDQVRIVDVSKVDFNEQRKTEWMVFESLADFLDPNDISKTIEGYPAPHRAIVIGERTRE